MSDIEDFIGTRIAAGDPSFARDASYRSRQAWLDLEDTLWPYVCLTCFLRRLYGIETPDEIHELDATPEMQAAHQARVHGP